MDGAIFNYQARGGINRLYAEILPRMCDLEPSLRIELLVSGTPMQALPYHDRIRQQSLPPLDLWLRPMQWWGDRVWQAREWIQYCYLRKRRGAIWHSTYYTMQRRWDGPVVVSVMDMIYERFPHLFAGSVADSFRERKRRAVRAADIVICISRTTEQDVREFYGLGSENIRVIPLACSEVFRPLLKAATPLPLPICKPFLLYVGDRAHYKNFSLVLRAYGSWRRRNEVDLVVVGKIWSKQERRQIEELRISECVHLRVNADDQSLCRLYNEAAAFIYPSLYEGFGIPLLEAMACGCPVIASEIPAIGEVAGPCPIYFEPSELQALTAAFDLAFSEGHDSKRVRYGIEWTKRYSWDETARRTLEVYREIAPSN